MHTAAGQDRQTKKPAYLDDGTEQGFVSREFVLVLGRLFLPDAPLEVLVSWALNHAYCECTASEIVRECAGRTLVIRTPKYTSAFTASISGRVSRACWYSRRRSSSGTPSRYWMYSAIIRTLLELLPQTRSGFAEGSRSCDVHDLPAVQ